MTTELSHEEVMPYKPRKSKIVINCMKRRNMKMGLTSSSNVSMEGQITISRILEHFSSTFYKAV